ncbi:hypothetical protein PRVXT_002941 [Proteinivorax tanatarense]|uniref:Uncharacterized protein n=1 Tax=Proteinivorax tanatarense TaxID=1260629 RepID=A0AAU7VLH7_9FIRM
MNCTKHKRREFYVKSPDEEECTAHKGVIEYTDGFFVLNDELGWQFPLYKNAHICLLRKIKNRFES